jgi:hemolysin activation/secretion protein
MRGMLVTIGLAWAAMLLGVAPARAAQNPVDRADPSVIEQELREPASPDLQADSNGQPLVETSDDPDTALAQPVYVRAIRVDGAAELAQSAFGPAARPFVGRTLYGEEMSALAAAVADTARRAGYPLATAWIPEQTVARGILRVEIDEGRIEDVRAIGSAGPMVRRLLLPLANGRPVRAEALERALLLAGDLPGVELGKARIEQVEGRNLLVLVAGHDRYQARAGADNWGSETVGPVRAHLAVDINGLLAGDDRVTLGGVTTPFSPKEFGLARIAYTKLVGAATEVTVGGYAARSRPGGILSDRDFEGQSLEASVGVSHALLRSRRASLWTEIEFLVRDSEQSLDDVTVRNDRLAIVRAGGFVNARLGGGRARARLTLAQGLPVFGATRADDPASSRPDGSAVFTKLEAWARYERALAGPLSVQLQAEGQLASRPLLSSEEMGLGGRSFLRGYDFRELSGDQGIAGAVELRWTTQPGGPLEELQLYGYADAGSVGNLDGGTGGGSLFSAGGGVRASLAGQLEAGLELGVPLKTGEDPDEELDPRVSFVLGTRF